MSYIGTADAAFIPQVYRNTRTATRKRRAAPQLPSTIFTQVMSYVPEECPDITDNARRCGASVRYRNQLNQQSMDCSLYCLQHAGVWLRSLLQDLAQLKDISFDLPTLNREYLHQDIMQPITVRMRTSLSPGENIELDDIELDVDTTTVEIDEFVAKIQQANKESVFQLRIVIPVQLSEYKYEDNFESMNEQEQQEALPLSSLIGSDFINPVNITDPFFTSSSFRHFLWQGNFPSDTDATTFYLSGFFTLRNGLPIKKKVNLNQY